METIKTQTLTVERTTYTVEVLEDGTIILHGKRGGQYVLCRYAAGIMDGLYYAINRKGLAPRPLYGRTFKIVDGEIVDANERPLTKRELDHIAFSMNANTR